jgi:hypothetical protein
LQKDINNSWNKRFLFSKKLYIHDIYENNGTGQRDERTIIKQVHPSNA